MRLLGLSAVVATFAIQTVSAANRFTGIVAANSKSSGACRTASDWNAVLDSAKAQGFTRLRILGNDCNAFDLATGSAKARGIKVLAGVYANSGTMAASNAQIDNDVGAFVNAVRKYGADAFDGITIGNEVNDSAINIMNKVWSVRGYLRDVIGYYGPVSSVHTWVYIRDNPVMCQGDRVTANAHAFFDGTPASNAGPFVSYTVYPALVGACPGKSIVITESGWPSRGGSINQAVPSLANEQAALRALNCAASGGATIYAFEADDLAWKSNDNERR
ncbi:hypothetical protein FRC02_009411 [Tulasnella sp. 418]|nr:hypothetical protein FRC02_009411 [Tulasnella sp. 418]